MKFNWAKISSNIDVLSEYIKQLMLFLLIMSTTLTLFMLVLIGPDQRKFVNEGFVKEYNKFAASLAKAQKEDRAYQKEQEKY